MPREWVTVIPARPVQSDTPRLLWNPAFTGMPLLWVYCARTAFRSCGHFPVTIAKQTVYPGRGIYSGKTLGEILASSPKQILWIADKYPNPTVKEAASLLVPEARRLTGM